MMHDIISAGLPTPLLSDAPLEFAKWQPSRNGQFVVSLESLRRWARLFIGVAHVRLF